MTDTRALAAAVAAKLNEDTSTYADPVTDVIDGSLEDAIEAVRAVLADRGIIYAAVDHAILHATGEADPVGFKDFDHDDLAEAVTQSVMLALGQSTKPAP